MHVFPLKEAQSEHHCAVSLNCADLHVCRYMTAGGAVAVVQPVRKA